MSIDEPSLARLMAASQRGDRAAYRSLLADCRRWLERYYARRIAPHHVDDLVQETLVSMHRKLATWDSSRPFLPWLAAIARYRWIDMLRRQRDVAELGDNDAAVGAEDEAVHARLSIDRLLQFLPPGQAQAITLVKIEGASIAEASRICGQSESLVKVNIHRGLKKLALMIESE
ncbi:sigma-70 family RNA polymerase sigma factor [Sphingopyxis sp. XHP0097]|jgi:RNA polymerase sigma-70 factor (ECF subfamily)|uniref:Sigma-70 family RNA polymerase sigma factor n=1 Tax=Sphingopyxis jiangsuensis TaxID=2871171 RepID=A0ABS7MGR4_9SPHN|nr:MULTISPECIES: sigma-70 family RNA polymerase sigma factor [Sphingopyxis]MBL0768679.1 sigma-70 family RNA polymerase sigma factor [Sphingopyxis lutea]MBY4638210.1 sigma-70 family RNA polymerase sigma factor [Sphingopyxis jiangsuensis]